MSNIQLIDIKTLSVLLSIPVGELYKMVQKRQIPHVRLGARIRFNVSEVEKYIKQRTVTAVAVGGD